jgi:hypothetical protein
VSGGSEHDAAAAGLRACVPSRPQAKAIAHNHLHEELVCRRRQAEAHPKVTFPLRPEIEIQHGPPVSPSRFPIEKPICHSHCVKQRITIKRLTVKSLYIALKPCQRVTNSLKFTAKE